MAFSLKNKCYMWLYWRFSKAVRKLIEKTSKLPFVEYVMQLFRKVSIVKDRSVIFLMKEFCKNFDGTNNAQPVPQTK